MSANPYTIGDDNILRVNGQPLFVILPQQDLDEEGKRLRSVMFQNMIDDVNFRARNSHHAPASKLADHFGWKRDVA